MKRITLLLLLQLGMLAAGAASVDTVVIYSASMKKDYKCVVIKPAGYAKSRVAYPVVYLLHGYGGWYSNWIIRVKELKAHADQWQLLIVCPEGGNSWYIDSPLDSTKKFETYIAREVTSFIDRRFRTIRDPRGRAVTGLSMGGHGGLYLGLRNRDVFGACGSMSGGVDLRPFPKRWELTALLGDSMSHAANWTDYSVAGVMEKYQKDSLAILIDCGVDDFFYAVNQSLHERMLQLKIPHDFIIRPGKHDWTYWTNAVEYQLLFFRRYFDRSR